MLPVIEFLSTVLLAYMLTGVAICLFVCVLDSGLYRGEFVKNADTLEEFLTGVIGCIILWPVMVHILLDELGD